VVPLSVGQVAALAEAMPQRNRAMVMAQAGLGLRIGELLGLRVQDVDFLRRSVRVEWQIAPGAKVRSAPKTRRSTRTVPLPQVVAEALSVHLNEYPPGPDGALSRHDSGLHTGTTTTGRGSSRRRSPKQDFRRRRLRTTYVITMPRCYWLRASRWSLSPRGWATTTPRWCSRRTAT
jgi:integrase